MQGELKRAIKLVEESSCFKLYNSAQMNRIENEETNQNDEEEGMDKYEQNDETMKDLITVECHYFYNT